MVVLGGPLNVRLAGLGLWWLMPAGLAELAQMWTSDSGRRSVVRHLGMLSTAVVAALALAGLRGWCDGLLLALYLLTERG
jgi:hypothetical protein